MNQAVASELVRIIEILKQVSGVESFSPEEDFYAAGVTSVQALPLLLDLESEFDVTIPDERFLGARTAKALQEMILELKSQ